MSSKQGGRRDGNPPAGRTRASDVVGWFLAAPARDRRPAVFGDGPAPSPRRGWTRRPHRRCAPIMAATASRSKRFPRPIPGPRWTGTDRLLGWIARVRARRGSAKAARFLRSPRKDPNPAGPPIPRVRSRRETAAVPFPAGNGLVSSAPGELRRAGGGTPALREFARVGPAPTPTARDLVEPPHQPKLERGPVESLSRVEGTGKSASPTAPARAGAHRPDAPAVTTERGRR